MSETKWVVVLGASAGVGGSLIRAAAAAGYDTFGMHRGNWPEAADAISAEIEGRGRTCVWHVADAGTIEGIEAGMKTLREHAPKGSIAMIVHSLANASIGRFTSGDASQFHPKQFSKTFQGMAHSFVHWTQQLLEHEMLAPGALVLGLTNPIPDNIADGFGLICASKAALEMYVRFMAKELGPRGYRVNLLNFGLVETEAVRRAFRDEDWQVVTEMVSRVAPRRRLQTTDEVAAFIMGVMLRPEMEYMTGATIDYTGGQAQGLLDLAFSYRKYGLQLT